MTLPMWRTPGLLDNEKFIDEIKRLCSEQTRYIVPGYQYNYELYTFKCGIEFQHCRKIDGSSCGVDMHFRGNNQLSLEVCQILQTEESCHYYQMKSDKGNASIPIRITLGEITTLVKHSAMEEPEQGYLLSAQCIISMDVAMEPDSHNDKPFNKNIYAEIIRDKRGHCYQNGFVPNLKYAQKVLEGCIACKDFSRFSRCCKDTIEVIWIAMNCPSSYSRITYYMNEFIFRGSIMKKFISLLCVTLVVLTGCNKEVVKANIEENTPPGVSKDEVQGYVDDNYPQYSEDVKEAFNDTTPTPVGVEDIIQNDLNANLNGMLDLNEEILCFINIQPNCQEIVVGIYCTNNDIKDDWVDVNSSMFLLGLLTRDLNSNLDNFLSYGKGTIQPAYSNQIKVTFNYYNEAFVNCQNLTVNLRVKDKSLFLDPDKQEISLMEFTGKYTDGAPDFCYDPYKNTAIYKSEYFPFKESGVWNYEGGNYTTAYKYVG